MKYVRILCYAAVAINLCSPAWAGRGNALAGGWDSSLTSATPRSAPATAPASPSTAPASTGPSTSLFSTGAFGGSVFTFGSGGGSSGNTGGAPSPEVNATLGLILVGGTVAFLRRRRTGNAKPQG